MKVTEVTLDDDVENLVGDINSAQWDDANEMSRYEQASLNAYLNRPDTLFIACYDDNSKLAGIASSRLEVKPYDASLWLYVDEVDVCADQRRKGAGKIMMQYLINFANTKGCDELWVATEDDNHPARALYQSLNAEEESPFIGYTFVLRNNDEKQ